MVEQEQDYRTYNFAMSRFESGYQLQPLSTFVLFLIVYSLYTGENW
jgi:hypothetical protein